VPAWQRLQLYAPQQPQTEQQQQGAAGAAGSGPAATETPRQPAAAAAAGGDGSAGGSATRRCTACFVTTRILVVDLLSHRLRPQQIAGVRCCSGWCAKRRGGGQTVRRCALAACQSRRRLVQPHHLTTTATAQTNRPHHSQCAPRERHKRRGFCSTAVPPRHRAGPRPWRQRARQHSGEGLWLVGC
jgi:hypothetical protein